MFRRLFWLSLGLGAGATSAVLASRWLKRQTHKMAPAYVAKTASTSLLELGKKVAESVQEGRAAAEQREREVREKAKLD
ncbi:MAG: hypothetical protein WD004_07305 [Actinomycetota bacterium]